MTIYRVKPDGTKTPSTYMPGHNLYTQEQFDMAAELMLNGFTREGAAYEAMGQSWAGAEVLAPHLPNDQWDDQIGRVAP